MTGTTPDSAQGAQTTAARDAAAEAQDAPAAVHELVTQFALALS